jgi:HAD superfamily hydrolase (TIGR01549 family)
MTEEFDAVLLDLGGTLVEMKPGVEEVFARTLERHGLSDLDKERLAEAIRQAEGVFDEDFARMDERTEGEVWRRYDDFVFDSIGFDGDRETAREELTQAFRQIVPDPENWVAYPDAKPFLEALANRDFRKGVLSNATELARKVLDNLGFSKYFDFVIISDEVKVRKPSPEIFLMAARKAKTAPGRALYFGDKLAVDIRGAQSVGMPAILVDRKNVYPNSSVFRVRSLDYARRFL